MSTVGIFYFQVSVRNVYKPVPCWVKSPPRARSEAAQEPVVRTCTVISVAGRQKKRKEREGKGKR